MHEHNDKFTCKSLAALFASFPHRMKGKLQKYYEYKFACDRPLKQKKKTFMY